MQCGNKPEFLIHTHLDAKVVIQRYQAAFLNAARYRSTNLRASIDERRKKFETCPTWLTSKSIYRIDFTR